MRNFTLCLIACVVATQIQAEETIVDMAAMTVSHEVNQITDPKATAATNMFRFDPPFIQLEPGDELVFLNSRGEHTVHSVPQLWPADKDPLAVSNQPRASVTFDQAGIYGLRCKRHGLYGMALLVRVGDGGSVTSIDEAVAAMRARPREKAAFLNLFDEFVLNQ